MPPSNICKIMVTNQCYFEDEISMFNTPFILVFRPDFLYFLVYGTYH